MKSNWINNNGITIEYIDSKSDTANNEFPFVIVPGLSESVEDYISLIKLLSPRRCVALSLRGRGRSDAPESGYTLEDHISDIDAVIKHLNLNEFILMGYSRGVSYALGYALTNLDAIKGMVLGDYGAYHTQLPHNWVEVFSTLPPWRGIPLSERMPLHALHGLQKDSSQVLFWDQLNLIHCPVLIIRGGKEGAALSEENSMKYLQEFKKCKISVFEESSHNIFEPELGKFVEVVEEFMENI